MKKNIFPILILAILFAFSACAEGGNTMLTEPSITENAAITELTVWGMTCNRCVNNVTRVVSALDGVITVSVDLKAEKVTVTHDINLDVEEIKNSITTAGYNIP